MTERDLLKIISENIKWHRSRSGMSQAQLAEIVDISISFLSDIETSRKWPSPTTLVNIAGAFKIEPYELLKPADKMPDDASLIIDSYTKEIFETITNIKKTYSKNIISKLKNTLICNSI
jgi:transcriptional regulator with XRE-family HTH domain